MYTPENVEIDRASGAFVLDSARPRGLRRGGRCRPPRHRRAVAPGVHPGGARPMFPRGAPPTGRAARAARRLRRAGPAWTSPPVVPARRSTPMEHPRLVGAVRVGALGLPAPVLPAGDPRRARRVGRRGGPQVCESLRGAQLEAAVVS